jgi:copper chaperone CopZ
VRIRKSLIFTGNYNENKPTLRSNTLRKATIFVVLVLAAVALFAIAAYACGEKGTNSEKAETTATATTASSKGKVCPVSAVACDPADKPSGTAAVAADETEANSMIRTIAVTGMTCTSCEKTISAALAEVPGVTEVVKVCHKSAEAVVKVDPAEVENARLTQAIADKGYQAEIIPAVAKTTEVVKKGSICPLSGGPKCETSSAKTASEKKADGTH